MLILCDPTVSDKQSTLRAAFLAQQGEVYIGKEAWGHLDGVAGSTMSMFIARYVQEPIEALLAEIPPEGLPDLTWKMTKTELTIWVAGEKWTTRRERDPALG